MSDDTLNEKFGTNIRAEFYMRPKNIYLNNGSYGTTPRRVLAYKMRLEEELELHADDWFRRKLGTNFQTSLATLAGFIHTDPTDTFFVQNVTKGVNTVLKSYAMETGGAVLVSNLAYGAIHNTAEFTTSLQGAELVQVKLTFPIESENQVVRMYEQTLATHPNIRFAVIEHITSSTAIHLPVKTLTELCHKHDVIVVIDGAHAPGQIPLNLPDIDADFYSGTKDDSAYFSVPEALRFLEGLGGLEAVTRYNRELKERVVKYLAQSWGTEPLQVPASMEAPFMGLVRLPNIPGYDISPTEAERLFSDIYETYGIQTVAVCIQGSLYIRVSTQVYNTMEDFQQLNKAMQEMTVQSNLKETDPHKGNDSAE